MAWLKKLTIAFAAASALAAVAASPSRAAGELHLYNWGEYINPEVIDRFSKEFDVKVSLDTYSTNEEMLAKIQAGAEGYDLVWPSVHINDIMLQLGLLEETRINQAKGFENIDPGALRWLLSARARPRASPGIVDPADTVPTPADPRNCPPSGSPIAQPPDPWPHPEECRNPPTRVAPHPAPSAPPPDSRPRGHRPRHHLQEDQTAPRRDTTQPG